MIFLQPHTGTRVYTIYASTVVLDTNDRILFIKNSCFGKGVLKTRSLRVGWIRLLHNLIANYKP